MSREAVIATALYVMGRVRRRVHGGSDVDNAIHYLNKLKDPLTGLGINVGNVERLIREGSVMRYISYAVGKSIEPGQECQGDAGVVIDFIGGGALTIGPASMLDVVKDGVKARGSYRDVVNELDRGIDALAALHVDYQQFMETLLATMKLTLLYVPYSNCEGGSRYSAYSTAHAAMAYASTEATGGNYKLLGIDVVGIQDVIGRIQRTKQAMRQLKGRSILINLIQQAAAVRIINDVNNALKADVLSPVNILVNTGGEVIMLIPGVEDGVLSEVVSGVESDVVNEFEGRLGLAIAYTRVHGVDEGFRGAVDELERELTRRRYGRYRRVVINGVGLCDMCGMASENLTSVKMPDGTTLTMCHLCCMAHKIGTVSRRLGFIARLRTSSYSRGGCVVARLLGVDYAICPDGVNPAFSSEYVHYHLNEFGIEPKSDVAHSVIFLNTLMPTEPTTGEVMDLEEIKMGGMAITVKADANSMGRIKASASRDAATYILFTNLLMTMFDAYGAYLLNSNQSRYGGSVFLIYSGGDDVVVVGDHMALDYMARLIMRANEFSINVAAGALIHDVYQPIYLVWLDTENRLEEAKRKNRNASLMYVINIGGAPVMLEPSDVLNIVDYVSRKHDYAELEETRERGVSMLYRLNSHLVKIYDALYKVAVLKEEKKNSGTAPSNADCLSAKRSLLRALIEYTYYFNRNRDTVSQVINELGRELTPENLANMLKSVECGNEGRAGQYLRVLGRAIASINIYVLKTRSEGGAGW